MRHSALSAAALLHMLRQAPDSLLIGGQALAWWADVYGTDTAADFPEGVTFDIDFLGSREEARAIAGRLGAKLYLPTIDDATPQSAKLYLDNFLGEGELEVDFLASLAGGEEKAIRNRAITVTLEDTQLRVMHPYDVLRSRIVNLHLLRSRSNNPRYIAQAQLAVRVLHAYLQSALAEGAERVVLKIVEAVVELAESKASLAAWRKQQIDLLHSIPAGQIADANFQQKRWPQALAYIAARRAKGQPRA